MTLAVIELDSVTRFVWTDGSEVYHRAKYDIDVQEAEDGGDPLIVPYGEPYVRGRCNISDASRPRRKPLRSGDEPPEGRRGCMHCTRGGRFPT